MSDVDYSKMSNEELEKIASGSDQPTQGSAALGDIAKVEPVKVPAPMQIHPALGAVAGGYLGSKAAAPITGWYAAKTASDIGDIATNLRAGQPIPGGIGAPEPAMTGGEKWTHKLTGSHVPGAQMAKEDLDLAKQMQRTVGRGGELAGGAVTKGGIMVGPRDVPAAAKLATEEAKGVAAAKPSLLSRIAVPSGTLGKMVNIGAPVLAGAGAGAEFTDMYNRIKRGEYGRAGLSFLGGVGSAASMIPHPLARIGGTGVAMAAPAINAAIDYMLPPEQQPAMSGSVMQGYADGGGVNNDQLMQMLRASRTARVTNMQSRPGKYLAANSPVVQFVPRAQLGEPGVNAMYQPSINTVSMERRPGGMTPQDLGSLAHEFQHAKDTQGAALPQDEELLRGIQGNINRYTGQILDTNRMPVDAQARNALTQQAGAKEVMPQLAGYEAGLPAGMNIMQSGLGQTLTPQQKAMILRKMNPLPPGVDAMVGGYATGGLVSLT